MHKAEVVADWFRRAEANCRLEGFDATGTAFYEDLKARVIAGELSPEQALNLSAARWTQSSNEGEPAAIAATAA